MLKQNAVGATVWFLGNMEVKIPNEFECGRKKGGKGQNWN